MPTNLSSSWLLGIGAACVALISIGLSHSSNRKREDVNADEGSNIDSHAEDDGKEAISDQSLVAASRGTDELLHSVSNNVQRRKQLLRRLSERSMTPSPTQHLSSESPLSSSLSTSYSSPYTSPSVTWRETITPDLKSVPFTSIASSSSRYSLRSTSSSEYSPQGHQVTLISELQEKRELNNRIGVASFSPRRHEKVAIASAKKRKILQEIRDVREQIAKWENENESINEVGNREHKGGGRNRQNTIDIRYLHEKLSCLRTELLTVEKDYVEERKQDRKKGLQEVKARLLDLQSAKSSSSLQACTKNEVSLFNESSYLKEQEKLRPYPLDKIKKQEEELVKEAFEAQLKEREVARALDNKIVSEFSDKSDPELTEGVGHARRQTHASPPSPDTFLEAPPDIWCDISSPALDRLDIESRKKTEDELRYLHIEIAEILSIAKERKDLDRLQHAVMQAKSKANTFGVSSMIDENEVESLSVVEGVRDVLLLKIRNRKLYNRSVQIIGRLILSVIWKRRHMRHPRILVLYLMSGCNIEDAAHSLSFGALPDIFVNISTVSSTNNNRCLSRCQSSIKSQIEDKPCEWHEKFLLVIENDADHIVLNVMSTAALTGDSFVGQTVINLGHYPMLSSCNTVVRTNVGIHGRLEYPIFDTCGKAIHKEHIVGSYEGGGVLRLGLSIPRYDQTLCGWFTEVFQTVFGGKESRKVFIVLHDHTIGMFFNPFCGASGLLRQIECHSISGVKEEQIMPEGENDKILHSLRITILSAIGGKEDLVWVFDESSLELRDLWLKAIQMKQSFYDTVMSSAHLFDGGNSTL